MFEGFSQIHLTNGSDIMLTKKEQKAARKRLIKHLKLMLYLLKNDEHVTLIETTFGNQHYKKGQVVYDIDLTITVDQGNTYEPDFDGELSYGSDEESDEETNQES